MKLFCTECGADVEARLTDGSEMYPHRPELHHLKMWVHDTCGASVGVHKGSVRPYGFLAGPEIKTWRRKIHEILDPLWKGKKIRRGAAYALIGAHIGRTEYHTGEIYSVEEGKRIYEIVKELKEKLDPGPWNK